MRWIGLLVLMLTLAACGSGQAPATPGSQEVPTTGSVQDAPAPTVDPANAGLVARVNGEGITREEYDRELSRRTKYDTAADPTALAADVLDGLIEQRLVANAAASMGITVTDQAATAEVDVLKGMMKSPDDWQLYLDNNGYTEAEMQQAQKNVLLAQGVQQVIFSGLEGNVRQVHARHIVVRTEAEANDILNRLKNGEDFVELASQFSIDTTSKDRGGDLGWFVPGELLDRRLAEVAFSLKQGAIAGPIATSIGYHIIQSLEFAERPIEQERLELLRQYTYERWLESQFQQAKIERYI